MKKHQIVYIRVEDLFLNDRNPRFNEKAVDTVAKSIQKYGFKNPLIVDTNNVVYCGNTRLKAARKLKIEEVPCIIADDLTEQQIREYALLDNKTNEIAEWDLELLEEELKELSLEEFGLDWEIPTLEEEKEPQEDEYDVNTTLENMEEPRCKQGEIWQLGRHTLMCGDSTNPEDVKSLMAEEVADMVMTDPPYNVAIQNSQGMKIENDDMDNEDFKEFLLKAFYNLEASLKEGGAFYVWYASRNHIPFETALKGHGLTVRQQLIWNKSSFVFGRQDYHWKHEPCLYGWKDGASHYFIDDRTQSTVIEDKNIDLKKLKKEELLKLLEDIYSDKVSTTVIDEDKVIVNSLHPTMKPIRLIARLIKNSSRPGELVLDLFGGSGSTLIACEQIDRRCKMMEYDPKYASVIIDRWEEFTGKKAIKIKGEQ